MTTTELHEMIQELILKHLPEEVKADKHHVFSGSYLPYNDFVSFNYRGKNYQIDNPREHNEDRPNRIPFSIRDWPEAYECDIIFFDISDPSFPEKIRDKVIELCDLYKK